VRTGGSTPLHDEEALLLCGAAVLVAIALTIVGIASDRLAGPVRVRLAAAAAIAAAVILGLVPLAHSAMPGAIVGGLAVSLAALAFAIKRTHTAARQRALLSSPSA
jgi:hypothetical protein